MTNPKLRIAICIPVHGDTRSKFTQSLSMMLIHFMGARLTNTKGEVYEKDVNVFMVSSSDLCGSRHRLVAEALAWGATHMLWMDSDHVFPESALAHLWSHGLPVVGANYARRGSPTAPTAAVSERVTEDDGEDYKNLLYTTREKAEGRVVEPCAHLGLGLCLIDMRVFDVVQSYCESIGQKSFLPLFKWEQLEDGHSPIGEDVYFFRKLSAAGIQPFVDHAISWETGHIGEQIFTNAHTLVQKGAWAERQQALAKKLVAKAEEIEDLCEAAE